MQRGLEPFGNPRLELGGGYRKRLEACACSLEQRLQRGVEKRLDRMERVLDRVERGLDERAESAASVYPIQRTNPGA